MNIDRRVEELDAAIKLAGGGGLVPCDRAKFRELLGSLMPNGIDLAVCFNGVVCSSNLARIEVPPDITWPHLARPVVPAGRLD